MSHETSLASEKTFFKGKQADYSWKYNILTFEVRFLNEKMVRCFDIWSLLKEIRNRKPSSLLILPKVPRGQGPIP